MISSTLPNNQILDLKKSSLDKKESAQKTKSKGFGDELADKQKKLKKKEDDVAPVQGQNQERRDQKVSTEEKSSQKSASPKKLTSDIAAAQKNTNTSTVDEKAEGTEGQINAELVESLEQLGQGSTFSVDSSVDLSKNLTGKFSLEGFQAVTPEAVNIDMSAPKTEEAALEALKNMVSSVETKSNTGESASKDLLSQQNKEESLGSLNLGTDALQALHGNKESAQTNFAAVLKAQDTQGVDNLKQANVDNIVSQARTILRDGGGEMQVVLTPEGMGTVDLKVGVDKGQVSVEIVTQDKDVKKLFDDSMMDIRQSLEGQNLKVDTVKVSVSENFDNQQQMSQGQFEMMERDFAREFLGQFRDERQGFRTQNMADRLGQNPMQPNQPEGLKPANRPTINNGRLNVVA